VNEYNIYSIVQDITTVEELKDIVFGICRLDEFTGLLYDLLSTALQSVNFEEIFKALKEE